MRALGTSFAPIVKKAAPSVVTIYSSRTIHVQPMAKSVSVWNDPMFRQFFGDQFHGDDQPQYAQGAGAWLRRHCFTRRLHSDGQPRRGWRG